MAVQASSSTYGSRLRTGTTSMISPATQNVYQRPTLRGQSGSSRGLPPVNYSELPNQSEPFMPLKQEELSEEAKYQIEIEQGGDDRGFVTGPPPDSLIRRQPFGRTPYLHRTDEQLYEAAKHEDILVPIRLELDIENHSFKDFFTWNLTEGLITPDLFAQIMCADLDIPASIYAPKISLAIRTQVAEYAPVAEIKLPTDHEMRVMVNLSVHFARQLLTDQFEWNLADRLTPEEFSSQLCADMGLTGEYIPAIAHAIHEELLELKKEACEGGLSFEVDNDAAFGADAGVRLDLENLGAAWQPVLELRTRDEMDRRILDRDRRIRKLRRDSSKFGMIQKHTEISGKESNDLNGSAVNSEGVESGPVGDFEKARWRCVWCQCPGTGTWAFRTGRQGRKNLCHSCGRIYERTGLYPQWRKDLFGKPAPNTN